MASGDDLEDRDSNHGEVQKNDFQFIAHVASKLNDQKHQCSNQYNNDRVIHNLNEIFRSERNSDDPSNFHIELSDSKLMSVCSKSLSNKELAQILDVSEFEDETDQNFHQFSTAEFIRFLESTKSIIQSTSNTQNGNKQKSSNENGADMNNMPFLKSSLLTTQDVLNILTPKMKMIISKSKRLIYLNFPSMNRLNIYSPKMEKKFFINQL